MNQKQKELDYLNDELAESCYGNFDGFEVVKRETTDHWRHGTNEEIVVKSLNSGNYYMSCYRDSCKDEMGFDDMNGDEAKFFKVKPVEKVIIDYVKV